MKIEGQPHTSSWTFAGEQARYEARVLAAAARQVENKTFSEARQSAKEEAEKVALYLQSVASVDLGSIHEQIVAFNRKHSRTSDDQINNPIVLGEFEINYNNYRLVLDTHNQLGLEDVPTF